MYCLVVESVCRGINLRKTLLILNALHEVTSYLAGLLMAFLLIPKMFAYIGYVMFTGDFGKDVAGLYRFDPLLTVCIILSLSWLVKFYWNQRDKD